jgi:hypothetical protein
MPRMKEVLFQWKNRAFFSENLRRKVYCSISNKNESFRDGLIPCNLHDLSTTERPEIRRRLKPGFSFSRNYFFLVS